MRLILATNNQHKVEEIRAVLPPGIELLTLQEAGITVDIPEPYETLQENAREKATTILRLTGAACFSEDTGLEVFSLNGEPGVRSARYAGENASPPENIEKLLHQLEGKADRRAQFRTVVCLLLNGKEHYFEGRCAGRIADRLRGQEGFGYDPVFIPDGADRSFAEMTLEEKNAYSHRRKAMDSLVLFLKQSEWTKKEN